MSEVKNAVIKSAGIEIEDHGLLTAWLLLDYGNSEAQGFGGLCLYNPNFPDQDRTGNFIHCIMKVVGVRKWETLPGKAIRVRANGVSVWAIGNILKEEWFEPGREKPK